MSRITTVLASLTLACLAVLAPVGAAHAAPDAGPLSPGDGQVQPLAPDGNFYAYININFDPNEFCKWPNNQTNWGNGACRNRASSLWNNGHPHTYDDVLVFWGLNYSGASYCVPRGWALADLRNYAFNRPGPGTPGYGEWLQDNISSHYWAHNSTC